MLHDGKRVPVGVGQLRDFIGDFCVANKLEPGEPRVARVGKAMTIHVESRKPGELVAAWYVTDGKHVALVSYTSLDPANPQTAEELVQVQEMIPTIEFAPGSNPPTITGP